MKLVEVTVYYLEMLARSHRSVPAPRDGLTVLHVQSPSVPYYRSLYNAVGKDFYWLSRRKMTDEAFAIIIGDPRDELHVLHVDGTPAGFAELDRRQPDEIELVQFGLTPDFIGQGLGSGSCNGPSTKPGVTSRNGSGRTPARWITPPLCRITRRPGSCCSRKRRFAGSFEENENEASFWRIVAEITDRATTGSKPALSDNQLQ
jgi:hypothetical protein